MKPLLGLVLLAGLCSAETEFLARLEPGSPEQVYDWAGQGVRLLTEVEGSYLALLTDAECARLSPAQVLDVNPGGQLYFLVYDALNAEYRRPEYGTVLWESGQGVCLLRTTEDRVPDLNRLPVELYRLPMTPMVIHPETGRMPVPLSPVSDSLLQEIVNRVSVDSAGAMFRRLQDFYTRYSTTDSCRAAVEWARARMLAYGCDTVIIHNWSSGDAPNAIGVKYGRLNPNRIYVLCAHIDNTSPQQPDHCPGSDDNASGTVTVLEACRVLADCEFDYTFQFHIYTGEEQGLLGSAAWVAAARSRGDSILGAMNFDMVSYDTSGADSITVWGRTANPNCTALVNLFCATADTYALLRYRKLWNGASSSDHASFWNNGYVCIRSKEGEITPVYHGMGDTIGPPRYPWCGTNDVVLCCEGIKAAVATFAKLAGVRRLTAIADRQPPTANRVPEVRPNPCRDRAMVAYSVSRTGKVRLGLYDSAGRLVVTLAQGYRRAGTSSLMLQPSALPAGVYLLVQEDATGRKSCRVVVE